MNSNVLVKVWDREVVVNRRLAVILGVFAFVLFIALGANVELQLPFSPIPVTLQTFFVLLTGAVLGRKLGALSLLIYLFIGFLGLPVFAGGLSGLSRFLGPSGGYLFGFVLAAYVVGEFLGKDSDASYIKIVGAMLAGMAIIMVAGVTHLALVTRVPLEAALSVGLFPFIPGDSIEVLAAAGVYQAIQTQCRKIFYA